MSQVGARAAAAGTPAAFQIRKDYKWNQTALDAFGSNEQREIRRENIISLPEIKRNLGVNKKFTFQTKPVTLDMANSACGICFFDINAVQPTMVQDTNGNGETVPTFVYIHHETGTPYVGKAALEEAKKPGAIPQNLCHGFKCLFGKRWGDKIVGESMENIKAALKNVVLEGVGDAKDRIRYVTLVGPADAREPLLISPSALVRHVIIYLLCQYMLRQKEMVELIVSTVPAIQNHTAYRKMNKIFTNLGVAVLNVMAEPIGAFVWNYFRELKDGNPSIFAGIPECFQITHVLDLGAGTLDFATIMLLAQLFIAVALEIIKIAKALSDISVYTIGGNNLLGGSDMDNAICKSVTPAIEIATKINLDEPKYAKRRQQVLLAIKEAKERLTHESSAVIKVTGVATDPVDGLPLDHDHILTIEKCEEYCEPIAMQMVAELRKGLLKFNQKIDTMREQLGEYADKILNEYPQKLVVTGGPANMPLVQRVIAQEMAKDFPRIHVVNETRADIAVPLGMAIVASILYTDIFADTPLANLKADTISTFPHCLTLCAKVTRELLLPGEFGILREFYHGSMECQVFVPENTPLPHRTGWHDYVPYGRKDPGRPRIIEMQFFSGGNSSPRENNLIAYFEKTLGDAKGVSICMVIDINQVVTIEFDYKVKGKKIESNTLKDLNYKRGAEAPPLEDSLVSATEAKRHNILSALDLSMGVWEMFAEDMYAKTKNPMLRSYLEEYLATKAKSMVEDDVDYQLYDDQPMNFPYGLPGGFVLPIWPSNVEQLQAIFVGAADEQVNMSLKILYGLAQRFSLPQDALRGFSADFGLWQPADSSSSRAPRRVQQNKSAEDDDEVENSEEEEENKKEEEDEKKEEDKKEEEDKKKEEDKKDEEEEEEERKKDASDDDADHKKKKDQEDGGTGGSGSSSGKRGHGGRRGRGRGSRGGKGGQGRKKAASKEDEPKDDEKQEEEESETEKKESEDSESEEKSSEDEESSDENKKKRKRKAKDKDTKAPKKQKGPPERRKSSRKTGKEKEALETESSDET